MTEWLAESPAQVVRPCQPLWEMGRWEMGSLPCPGMWSAVSDRDPLRPGQLFLTCQEGGRGGGNGNICDTGPTACDLATMLLCAEAGDPDLTSVSLTVTAIKLLPEAPWGKPTGPLTTRSPRPPQSPQTPRSACFWAWDTRHPGLGLRGISGGKMGMERALKARLPLRPLQLPPASGPGQGQWLPVPALSALGAGLSCRGAHVLSVTS